MFIFSDDKPADNIKNNNNLKNLISDMKSKLITNEEYINNLKEEVDNYKLNDCDNKNIIND